MTIDQGPWPNIPMTKLATLPSLLWFWPVSTCGCVKWISRSREITRIWVRAGCQVVYISTSFHKSGFFENGFTTFFQSGVFSWWSNWCISGLFENRFPTFFNMVYFSHFFGIFRNLVFSGLFWPQKFHGKFGKIWPQNACQTPSTLPKNVACGA